MNNKNKNTYPSLRILVLCIVTLSYAASCAKIVSQSNQMEERMAGIKQCYYPNSTPTEYNECSQRKILEVVYTHMDKIDYVSNGMVGKQVVVSYVVSTEGSIVDIEIVQKLDPKIDSIAKEAVKKLDDLEWLAGIQNNKMISIRYNLPIKIAGIH